MSESPDEQLAQAIEQVNAIPDLDFVVITGDLVDEADPASFERFRILAQTINVPYYISVGNHDIDIHRHEGRFNRADFTHWCQTQFDFDLAPTGFVDYSVSPLPGIRLIAIDASLGTHPDPQGTVRPIQRNWLEQELNTHAHELAIVLIHQPPVATSPLFWEYRILPEEAGPLRRILSHSGSVAAVLSGHLHVPKMYTRQEIPYLVAPPVIGPVSAFRVFEIETDPASEYGVLRYRWQFVEHAPNEARPLWHAVVMGHFWDRRGETAIRIPAQWHQRTLASV